ncbi:sarcosine oxidase subunit gamma [Cognatiyoonia koreensis]|uniref:Sarcosine oxidase subunit gamma n=1 Tax=Cognatiyoonia koreensis TaxID=364200 RepID=A0A1I0NMM7_9RHOB|nr:sarcosine oxidase subunit gamma family protein [Cognatiyoonia koreensis]SEW02702.1 sarcosine oxidase subunit gamma [Cognatiyoonia koreensis]
MSNAVSALDGRVSEGAIKVADVGLRGMISLRGDLSSRKLRKVCTDLTGAQFPEQGKASGGLAWMSRDEVLIMVDYNTVETALAKIAKALKGRHHLAVNVSDARAVMTVSGPYAREVIAKLAPVDLHPGSFGVGDFRRTRLGQVAAAFWMHADDAFTVICFRSVGDYTFRLLEASAKAGPVGHF